MSDELDFIIANCSVLKINTDKKALKDLTFNSPLNSKSRPTSASSPATPTKLNRTTTVNGQIKKRLPENPTDIFRICYASIDNVLASKFPFIKSLDSSYLRLISFSFSQIYKLDLITEKKLEVFKKFKAYLLRLIELETSLGTNYEFTLGEIRQVFPHISYDTAPLKNEDTTSLVLLGHIPMNYNQYLSIVFITLQVIFKRFQQNNLEDSDTILEFFSKNLQFTQKINRFQKESVMKLILSFIKISNNRTFSHCLNLIFLEYLGLFGFKLTDFISNYTLSKYTTTVELNILRQLQENEPLDPILLSFIYHYSSQSSQQSVNFLKVLEICDSKDKSLNWGILYASKLHDSTSISLLINSSCPNRSQIRHFLSNDLNRTQDLHSAIGNYIKRYSKETDNDQQYIILDYLDNIVIVTKTVLSVLDKLVVASKEFLDSPGFIDLMFGKIQHILLKCNDLKRLKNISNLFYNFGIKLKDQFTSPNFLLNSMNVETLIYRNTEFSLDDISLKFEKSLKFLLQHHFKFDKIFLSIFNNEFLDSIPESMFFPKLELLEQKLGRVFTFIDIKKKTSILTSNLSQEYKTMLFALTAKLSNPTSELSIFFDDLNIEDPSLRMICGVYNENPSIVKQVQQKLRIPHSSIFDSLIKSAYYLTLEMKGKSTTNIHKILTLYISSWVPRNRYGLTLFEISFLQKFVEYLKFLEFHKAIHSLLSSIEKYNTSSNEKFMDWVAKERIQNNLSVGNVINSDGDAIRKFLSMDNRVESPVQHTLTQVSLLLLKMQFLLVKFDNEELVKTADDIMKVYHSNSELFTIDNKQTLPGCEFLESLKVLVALHYYSGKYLHLFASHQQSMLSFKKCVQLARSILRNKDTECDFELLTYISSSFKFLIKILIHLGISKEAEYYVNEFMRFNESFEKYKPIYCSNNYFVCYYYFVCGKISSLKTMAADTDRKFDELHLISYSSEKMNDEELEIVDNYSLVFFHYLTKIYEGSDSSGKEVAISLSRFFNTLSKESPSCSNIYKLYYNYHFRSQSIDLTTNISKNPYLSSMNYLIYSNRLFTNAKRSLESDPVFSTLEDSAMSIPSIKATSPEYSPIVDYKVRSKTMRNLKKAIIELKQARNQVLEVFNHYKYLSNYQINEIHKIMALNLLTLSSISNSYKNDSLDDLLQLGEYLKHQPLVNEKHLIKTILKNEKTELSSIEFNLDVNGANCLLSGSRDIVNRLKCLLPPEWLVISIDICSFNGDLIISQFQKGLKGPSVLRLPLSRHSSRTIDEESFSFEDAMTELKSIIEASNRTTSKERTESIRTSEDRQTWHKERRQLDSKLCQLFQKIEYCWLGGFKGIFNQDKINPEHFELFKEKFLLVINQNIPSRLNQRSNNLKTSIEINDFIIELFIKLGDVKKLISTELLEDLIYFVLDILLFHGEENAYDEIDIDNIYVEVEALLTDYVLTNPNPEKNKHTALILGKECLSIPWESLPCLRNCSTTRVCSVSMLLDLLAKHPDMTASKNTGSFCLNPSGDLAKTLTRMKPIVDGLEMDLKWAGITSRKPSEKEFLEFLKSNLFVYIGHGGGEQYARSTSLKELDTIAPTLLLGCSSCALQENNLLEPYGTVYSFLIGGCPMVVGNLWDVTDKDIDKFSISVFERWGLVEKEETRPVDICEAVRRSRDECSLRYLNGSAPVVYGLPLSLM